MSGLDEAIAETLGGLDELEQQLVEKQTELSRELNDVESALTRITAIREAALSGKAKTTRPPRPPKKSQRVLMEETRAQVIDYLRNQGRPVLGAEIAAELDRDPRGIGPILSGLVTAGLAEKITDGNGGSPRYRVTEETT